MIRKQIRSCAPATIERLEGRQLMSATHLVVPALAGDVFAGTATSKGGGSAVTVTIASESKSGKITGTLVVADGDNGPLTFTFKGSVNKKHVFSLNAITTGHQTAKLTGNVSADTTTMSGKFIAHKPKHSADTGTFLLHR
jgi:hypothetical protein